MSALSSPLPDADDRVFGIEGFTAGVAWPARLRRPSQDPDVVVAVVQKTQCFRYRTLPYPPRLQNRSVLHYCVAALPSDYEFISSAFPPRPYKFSVCRRDSYPGTSLGNIMKRGLCSIGVLGSGMPLAC